MRITQNMISNNMLKNLNKSYSQMDKYMDQLTTGKRINKPSDDPVASMNAMGYRTELARIEQYQRNTGELHSWYDNTDAALEHITSGLQRIRSLDVKASNGTYEEGQLQSIAEEVKQIKADIVDVSQTKVGDNYIFNGLSMNKPPQLDPNGNPIFKDGEFKINVSGEATLGANLEGNNVFGKEEENLFKVLDDFIKVLEGDYDTENPPEELETELSAYLVKIDDSIDNVINQRAELGARMNRLDLVENRLGQQEVVATKMVSDNEDVNYAEAITNLITQESIHRAALSTGARIIQPTLLDFLR